MKGNRNPKNKDEKKVEKKEMGWCEQLSKMMPIDKSRFVPANLPSDDEILAGLLEHLLDFKDESNLDKEDQEHEVQDDEK